MKLAVLRHLKTWYNPFQYIAGLPSLLIGAAVIGITALVAWLNHTYTDGIFDLHYGPGASLRVYLMLGISNWLSATLVLFLLALALSPSKIRIIDIAGTQALARFPMLLAIFTGFVKAPERVAAFLQYTMTGYGEAISVSNIDFVATLVVGLLVLSCIVWMVALMYHAYRVSSNLKGAKAWGSFIPGIIAAYVISKIGAAYIIALI